MPDLWKAGRKKADSRASGSGNRSSGDPENRIPESVFLAEGTRIVGSVTIGEESSVWYNAVIRGDEDRITIGARTNIQDNAVLHCDRDHPLTIGDDVTIGHGAIVHGCTVGSRVIIGMGAIIMNDACIGDNCIIGAGALVTQGMKIPEGQVAYGSPAQPVRPLKLMERMSLKKTAAAYVKAAAEYRK